MAQYNATLESMRGHVRQIKPNVTPQLVDNWLNEAVRSVLDLRPNWAGSIKHTIIPIPAVYNTGAVSLATGSSVATGVATAWPINDVVATALFAGCQIGERRVVPVAMTGITADTILVVDGGTANAEIVGVLATTDTTFTARFTRPHLAGATLTSSSLSGRQLRQSNQSPIFSILAITSATQMTLDCPWGGAPITNGSYEIMKLYYTVAVDIKEFLSVIDTVRNVPINFHAQLAVANRVDPTRQNSGQPSDLIDGRPNYCGNMQYEIYPPQRDQGQLDVSYFSQWKEMVSPSDRPPHFINPDVFQNYAIGRALTTKTPDMSSVNKIDPWYDPQTSVRYMQDYQTGISLAIHADNQKAQLALTYQQSGTPRGANYAMSHDVDADDLFRSL